MVGRGACIAWLAIAGCRKHEGIKQIDAAPIDAAKPDAPVIAPDAAVKAGPTPTKVVAAGDTSCAAMSDLTVRCWGGDAHGQLGNGLTADSTTVVAPEIRAVKDLQIADATVCAMLDDDSVACWGRIAWHGHQEDTLKPTGVLGVIGVKQIFVFAGRACARVANESLVCWGSVDQRGHFTGARTNRQPTPVVGLDHVVAMRPNAALAADGRLWFWTSDGAPKLVDLHNVKEISDREGTICGRLASGSTSCAGVPRCPKAPGPPPAPPKPAKPTKPAKAAKTAKTAKTAKKPAKPEPKPAPPPKPKGEPVEALGLPAARQLAFETGFCVVTTTNKLVCGDGCKRVDAPRLDKVDVAVDRCAILKDGGVTCIEDGKPSHVAGVTHVTSLAVGRAHACAIADGQVVCWGNNDHGQLGEFALAK